MLPSSPTKMKMLGPETPPLETTKPGPELKTIPVGLAPSVFVADGGMVTTSDCGTPWKS